MSAAHVMRLIFQFKIKLAMLALGNGALQRINISNSYIASHCIRKRKNWFACANLHAIFSDQRSIFQTRTERNMAE